MMPEIRDQRPSAEGRNSSHHCFPAQTQEQLRAKRKTRCAPAHRPASSASGTQAKKKLIATLAISEIELCSEKQATKQFSNRYKNALFGLLNGLEMDEKRSEP
jgi:hypothetical protein